jgi:hypothetical protein
MVSYIDFPFRAKRAPVDEVEEPAASPKYREILRVAQDDLIGLWDRRQSFPVKIEAVHAAPVANDNQFTNS